jgi:hypothetical protein
VARRAELARGDTAVTGGAPITVEAQWALYGKRLDREGYRVLACSSGELGIRNFEEVIGRFSPGTPSTLPQVTLSHLTPGNRPAESLLAMAIHRTGEGEQQIKYDDDGRRVVVTSYFCVPYHPLEPLAVSYPALYRAAAAALPLPLVDGPPIALQLAGRAGGAPAIDELTMRAAALLLTCQPVCVLGAEDTTAAERLAFIDTVMSLLPYGLRAKMTAATWTRPTNRDHRFRLFFSDTARGADADRFLYWGRPEATSDLTPGDDYAFEYLNWLREKVSRPTSELAQLTQPIGFGRDSILRAVQAVYVKSQRSNVPHLAIGTGSDPYPAPLIPVEPGDGRGYGEELLRGCAEHLRAGGPQHLIRTDIDRLWQMAQSQANDSQQARYRKVLRETRLLIAAGRLGHGAESLYQQLLRVAFPAPFGYADYCQLEDCLERQPPPLALLKAMHAVDVSDSWVTDPWVRAIVYGQLQQADPDNPGWRVALKRGPKEISLLISQLAAGGEHPDHVRIVCDFTLGCLSRVQPNPEPIRAELRRSSFLAATLNSIAVGSEQYQVCALAGFLRAAYPHGLDRPAIIEILTGNHRPPPPALIAAVLTLADAADAELAADMYVRGSLMSSDFPAEMLAQLSRSAPPFSSGVSRR